MRRVAGLVIAAALLGCPGPDKSTTLFSIDVQAGRGGPVTWGTGDASIATVSTSGLVTAVGNGTVDIDVKAGNASGRTTLTVAQVVLTLTVTPSSQSIAPGALFTFNASSFDRNL